MSKIKYLVTGIDNETMGSIIGTLAANELPGEADIVVVPNETPRAYAVNPAGAVREIPFSEFLGAAVMVERKKISERSSGENLIKEIVAKSVV